MHRYTPYVLTFVAGFCDTLTFLAMNGVFSSHVTGNFVLFAVALAQGASFHDYLKVMTFPVFVAGVVCAAWVYGKGGQKQGLTVLLGLESVLLTLCCLWAFQAPVNDYPVRAAMTCILVFAMAIQNSLHRFVDGPLTTVMTGTVMHTTMGFTEKYLLRRSLTPNKPTAPLWRSLGLIASFALGCLTAGFLTPHMAFKALIVPAFLLWWVVVYERRLNAARASS